MGGWVSAASSLELLLRKQLSMAEWCGTTVSLAAAETDWGCLLALLSAPPSQLLLWCHAAGWWLLRMAVSWVFFATKRSKGLFSPFLDLKGFASIRRNSVLKNFFYSLYCSKDIFFIMEFVLSENSFGKRFFLSPNKIQTLIKSVSSQLSQHTCAPD